MTVQFATCVRHTALEYIKAVYPSRKDIADTEESLGPLLNLVEADIVRIQDPMMYGKRIGVVAGENWDSGFVDAVKHACAILL